VKARLAHRVEYGALRGAVALLDALPYRTARRLGAALGVAGYRPLGIRRTVVVRQIAAAFPDMPPAEVRRVARAAYANLGRVAVETALLPSLESKDVLDLYGADEGFDALQRAYDDGRGVVLITGHFGNWELAGAYIAARGIHIEGIARRLNNPLVNAFVTRRRERAGIGLIHDADAVRRTPRALREGHAVTFIADQGVLGLASTYVPFFGRPAKTPRGAAVFALRFRVPTFFCVSPLGTDGKYHLVAERLEVEDTGDREADVDRLVARYTAMLEAWVRRHPEQYFWHHRRWKRQPPDTPPELRDPARSHATAGVRT
jgi:KDO2-lipid IV(A) lauroyltransferase